MNATVSRVVESVPDLDPGAIVRVLNQHSVRYVIIGGIAAQLHDLPVPATVDIDVTPARDRKNLECLARAFEELEAGLYTADLAEPASARLTELATQATCRIL